MTRKRPINGWYITKDGIKHIFKHTHNDIYHYDICDNLDVIEIFVPEGTKLLRCYRCSITKLYLPDSLISLSCFNNNIKDLILPTNIKGAFIDNNLIKTITLPNTVTYLSCDINVKITNLKDFINNNKVTINLYESRTD